MIPKPDINQSLGHGILVMEAAVKYSVIWSNTLQKGEVRKQWSEVHDYMYNVLANYLDKWMEWWRERSL